MYLLNFFIFYKFSQTKYSFNYRMAKSPISFLQEFAMKQGYVPMYDFKTLTTGKSNQFYCRVTCKNLSADSTGNSKKDAKQRAAENMLLLLDQTSQVSMSSTIPLLSRNENKTHDYQKSAIICAPSSSIHLEPTDSKKDINVKEPSCFNYIGLLQVSFIKYGFLPDQNNTFYI